ncbi:homeobox protein slou [Drosophila serrata]|uniref:homeobox protein slou n=1 Tax=Drosophila serrata TaxID=7274 RepID=UPI000A1D2429|nr:homeobox protein slou [Drosophila serrata]
MRSHVAVYRAPDTAPPPPPPASNYAPLRYHHHHQPPPPQPQQQHPPLSHWPGVQTVAPTPNPSQASAYRLHHGHPAPSWPSAPAATGQAQTGGYGGVVNQQRINECAGIPLISNASTHLSPAQRQRLLRKSVPKSPQAWPPGGASMSQLAVHAQGMPLLQQNGKQHQHLQQQQQQQHHHHHHPHHPHPHPGPPNWSAYQGMSSPSFKMADKSRVLRYQNSAPPVLSSSSSSSSQEKPQNSGGSCQDQGNSPSETCLPRIIKPRKRRKKDRKPGNGLLLKMESDMQTKINNQSEGYLVGGGGSGSYHLPPGILQHDHTHGVCFCRECDPLRSLWDYPLRRSLSDASSSEQGGGSSKESSTSTSSTSSTHSSDSSCDSSICSQSLPRSSSLALQEETTEEFSPITGDSSRADIVGVIGSQRSHPNAVTTPSQCLSDDSGYGDILSGINIANDLFGNCFRGGKLGNASSSSISAQAETLLDESLNEISRKLIETCNAADQAVLGSGSVSGSGSGAASDSGLDSAGSHSCDSGLVFNFEHLNLTDVTPTALDFLVDCNNNTSTTKSCSTSGSNNNCLGLVWRGGRHPNASGGGSHDDSQVAAAKLGPDSRATPARLILGTVGKLKPAFSTIS